MAFLRRNGMSDPEYKAIKSRFIAARYAHAALWALIAPCLFTLLQAQAAPNPAVEYQVKASLVFNFMHFIEWPADAFENGGQQIDVCLVGSNVYGNALRVLGGELVQGKTLAVSAYSTWTPELADSCQVIIFSIQERDAVRQSLAGLANKSALTVGETPEFLEDGGIIKFTIINDTVQFEVNVERAKQSRLNISSKLLRLANNVVTSSQTGTP
jgi:hypothetical protein